MTDPDKTKHRESLTPILQDIPPRRRQSRCRGQVTPSNSKVTSTAGLVPPWATSSDSSGGECKGRAHHPDEVGRDPYVAMNSA